MLCCVVSRRTCGYKGDVTGGVTDHNLQLANEGKAFSLTTKNSFYSLRNLQTQ